MRGAVISFLEWNHLPENRVYAYQFFSDNCSSRILSVLAQVFGDRLDAGCQNDEALGQTYREAIRPYIQGDPWLEAGIDFILGPRADRVMPPCGSSFLPDGLMAQLPLCRLDGKAFVGLRQELVPAQQPWFRAVNTPSLVHPLFWMLVLGVWSLFWSLRRAIQFKRGEETPRWERVSGKLVLPLVSVLGLLLLLMWGRYRSSGHLGQREPGMGLAVAVCFYGGLAKECPAFINGFIDSWLLEYRCFSSCPSLQRNSYLY